RVVDIHFQGAGAGGGFPIDDAKRIVREVVAHSCSAHRIGHQTPSGGERTEQPFVASGWFMYWERGRIDDQLPLAASDAPAGEKPERVARAKRRRTDAPRSATGAIERNGPGASFERPQTGA